MDIVLNESTRGIKKFDLIREIKEDNIRDFVVKALNKYGSEEKFSEANKVAGAVLQILEKKKLIDPNASHAFIDVMLASAFIHNLFYDAADFTTLYMARQKLASLATELKLSKQYTDPLFQTVEGQLGEDTPVGPSRPNPNTPGDFFATAVWIVKEYKPQA